MFTRLAVAICTVACAVTATPATAQQPSVRLANIVSGGTHACGIDADLAAWCWGDNAYGQRGARNRIGGTAPRRVFVGARFIRLAAGGTHTCGITTDGALLCWGANDAGQLGARLRLAEDCAGTACALVPQPVPGLGRVVDVVAGRQHTCATTSEGAVWCWGANDAGQLSVESRTACRGLPCAVAPQRVADVTFATRLRATGDRTCADTRGGERCWGGATDDLAQREGRDRPRR